jgi:hypothetical protein
MPTGTSQDESGAGGAGGKGVTKAGIDQHALALTPAVRQSKAYTFAMSNIQSIGMMGFMVGGAGGRV